MLPKTYEIHTCGDNCGRLIARKLVDGATFAALVAEADPVAGEAEAEDATLPEMGDLISEEGERLVEVFVQHEPVCSHCEESV